MAVRVLFVGLNPGKKPVRKGCAWDRFYEWLDYLGLDFVSFTNVSYDPDWSFKKKDLDISFLCDSIGSYDRVVAWGASVSKHLKDIGVDHFVLPHPSPRNRQINDKEFIMKKLDECKEYICGQ